MENMKETDFLIEKAMSLLREHLSNPDIHKRILENLNTKMATANGLLNADDMVHMEKASQTGKILTTALKLASESENYGEEAEQVKAQLEAENVEFNDLGIMLRVGLNKMEEAGYGDTISTLEGNVLLNDVVRKMLPFDAMHKVTGEVIKNIKMTNMMAISEVDELFKQNDNFGLTDAKEIQQLKEKTILSIPGDFDVFQQNEVKFDDIKSKTFETEKYQEKRNEFVQKQEENYKNEIIDRTRNRGEELIEYSDNIKKEIEQLEKQETQESKNKIEDLKKTAETLDEVVVEMKQFMADVNNGVITRKDLMKGDYDKALQIFSSMNYNFNQELGKISNSDIIDYAVEKYKVSLPVGGRLTRLAHILNSIIEANVNSDVLEDQETVAKAIALLETIVEFKGKWTSKAIQKQIQDKIKKRTEKYILYYGDPEKGHIRLLNDKAILVAELFHKLSIPFDETLFIKISAYLESRNSVEVKKLLAEYKADNIVDNTIKAFTEILNIEKTIEDRRKAQKKKAENIKTQTTGGLEDYNKPEAQPNADDIRGIATRITMFPNPDMRMFWEEEGLKDIIKKGVLFARHFYKIATSLVNDNNFLHYVYELRKFTVRSTSGFEHLGQFVPMAFAPMIIQKYGNNKKVQEVLAKAKADFDKTKGNVKTSNIIGKFTLEDYQNTEIHANLEDIIKSILGDEKIDLEKWHNEWKNNEYSGLKKEEVKESTTVKQESIEAITAIVNNIKLKNKEFQKLFIKIMGTTKLSLKDIDNFIETLKEELSVEDIIKYYLSSPYIKDYKIIFRLMEQFPERLKLIEQFLDQLSNLEFTDANIQNATLDDSSGLIHMFSNDFSGVKYQPINTATFRMLLQNIFNLIKKLQNELKEAKTLEDKLTIFYNSHLLLRQVFFIDENSEENRSLNILKAPNYNSNDIRDTFLKILTPVSNTETDTVDKIKEKRAEVAQTEGIGDISDYNKPEAQPNAYDKRGIATLITKFPNPDMRMFWEEEGLKDLIKKGVLFARHFYKIATSLVNDNNFLHYVYELRKFTVRSTSGFEHIGHFVPYAFTPMIIQKYGNNKKVQEVLAKAKEDFEKTKGNVKTANFTATLTLEHYQKGAIHAHLEDIIKSILGDEKIDLEKWHNEWKNNEYSGLKKEETVKEEVQPETSFNIPFSVIDLPLKFEEPAAIKEMFLKSIGSNETPEIVKEKKNNREFFKSISIEKQKEIWESIKTASSEKVYSLLSEAINEVITSESEFHYSDKKLKRLQSEKIRGQLYRTSFIPKKKGGYRQIDNPGDELKTLLRILLKILSFQYTPHTSATGFVAGKSIASNAVLHLKKKNVLTIDLKDFFPSITWGRIYGMFQEYPFHTSKDLARVLTNMVILNGSLPQGSPVSPYLSNMLCRKMDSRICQWAINEHISYSRYADDMTFSSNKANIFNDDTIGFITDIIRDEGFEINEKKLRIMPYFGRQMVTGVVVNKKLNVTKTYIRNLRAIIHNISKFGWEHQAQKYYDVANKIEFDLKNPDAFNVSDSTRTEGVHYSPKKLLEFVKSNKTNPSYYYLYSKAKDQWTKQQREYFEKEKEKGKEKAKLGYGLSNRNINIKMLNQKKSKKQRVKDDNLLIFNFKSIIKGKIEYIGQIRGKTDKVYKGLISKFRFLSATGKLPTKEANEIYENITKLQDGLANPYKTHNKKIEESPENTLREIIEELKEHYLEYSQLKLLHNNHETNKKEAKRILSAISLSPKPAGYFFGYFNDPNSFGSLVHSENPNYPVLEFFTKSEGIFEVFTQKYLLPDQVRSLFKGFLREYKTFIENDGNKHPWTNEKYRKKITEFKKRVRFGDNETEESDLIHFLDEEAELYRKQYPLKELIYKKVDLPRFYTDTKSVKQALSHIIESMITNNQNHESKTYFKVSMIKESNHHTFKIEIYDKDGIIKKVPDLTEIFGQKLFSALSSLRGLADWSIIANFPNSCCSYEFDVMQNIRRDLPEFYPGIKHIIKIYN